MHFQGKSGPFFQSQSTISIPGQMEFETPIIVYVTDRKSRTSRKSANFMTKNSKNSFMNSKEDAPELWPRSPLLLLSLTTKNDQEERGS